MTHTEWLIVQDCARLYPDPSQFRYMLMLRLASWREKSLEQAGILTTLNEEERQRFRDYCATRSAADVELAADTTHHPDPNPNQHKLADEFQRQTGRRPK